MATTAAASTDSGYDKLVDRIAPPIWFSSCMESVYRFREGTRDASMKLHAQSEYRYSKGISISKFSMPFVLERHGPARPDTIT
jgi:hypothetical protein